MKNFCAMVSRMKHRPMLKFYGLRTFRRIRLAKMLASPALNQSMLNTKLKQICEQSTTRSNAVYPGTFRTFLLTAGGANGQDADRLMNSHGQII